MTILSRLVLLTVASLALSLDQVRADIRDCDGDNQTMTRCIWQEYEAVDAELNRVWQQVMGSLNTAGDDYMSAEEQRAWRDGLLAAQRAWITFKEQDCRNAVMHEWWGGSGASAAIGGCLYRHTRSRLDDLRERYSGR